MDADSGLQALVQRLDNAVKHESRVLEASYEKWKAAQDELNEQYELLQEERGLLKESREALTTAQTEFEAEVEARWGAPADASGRLKLNVGGQVFETSAATLSKDRFSLLAAIVTQAPPQAPPPVAAAGEAEAKEGEGAAGAAGAGEGSAPAPAPAPTPAAPDSGRAGGGGAHFAADGSGTVFIDRDWWLFRHILAFLRHEALPDNLALLRQLYIESAYYRLHSMRGAIEGKLAADAVPGEVLAEPGDGGVPPTAVIPGPHGSFAPAPAAAPAAPDAPLDYTSPELRETIASRAREALSWATTGHGTSRARGGVPPAGPPAYAAAGVYGAAGAAAAVPPAPAALAGSLGGVRNMAALLASDELDGGWGARVGRGAGGWQDMEQEERDALGAQLREEADRRHRRGREGRRHRYGHRHSHSHRHGHGHGSRGRRWGEERSATHSDGSGRSSGRSLDWAASGRSAGSGEGSVPSARDRSVSTGAGWGLAAARGAAEHTPSSRALRGLSLDEKAAATRLPDPLGLWGRRRR